MKIILRLFFCLCIPTALFAQSSPFCLSAGFFSGTPLMHQNGAGDNFYMKNYSYGMGLNMGAYYTIRSDWQFGLYLDLNGLFVDHAKANQSILATQASPGYLYQSSSKGSMSTMAFGVEVSKIFRFKKWSLAPFLRSSLYYGSSGSFKFSLKEKLENEHYYKQTNWYALDSESYGHFAPLLLTGGIRVAYQFVPTISVYLSAQYYSGSIGMKVVKDQTDFYNRSTSEMVKFNQDYNLIGLEIGFRVSGLSNQRKYRRSNSISQ